MEEVGDVGYESDSSVDEEELPSDFFDEVFIKRFIWIVLLSVIVGLFISSHVFAYYFLPVPEQSLPLPPTHVAIIQVVEGELLLMWEPSPKGIVQHYRIYRWNNFLNVWKELHDSPTPKLGIKDTFLPSIWTNGTRIYYKVVAENSVNQSMGVELWYNLAYPSRSFDFATSSLAPEPLQTPIRLMDLSFSQGEEKLHIEWDRPEEKVLGHEIYFFNKIMKRYDEIESYDSIRNYSRFQVSNHKKEEMYCFTVKSVSWGDVGTSAPSYQRCIYIEKWAWETEKEEKVETKNGMRVRGGYQQLGFWRAILN